ncbi:RNA-binding S4 domain-containing protein [Hydrogenophaga sp. IBVHS1]|jgi:ribosome-associated heat shock protein Hsp15|uniref:RNA-binding S4 domain-containing protein n=1 Tax=unclassified Hydrogenophaga TaxID=2610897 RepID=UPI000A2EAF32|nr:RNA-binding S4 domain-containing protein [Hydrogenophaga sp. IBVHS1]OSZ75873.1 RNA-binding protein [Hydrogenophaga sp. IBVHS1]
MKTTSSDSTIRVRLDKWLWAARFYKTRSLSSEEIDKGRVKLNGASVKPSRDVKAGDVLEMRIGHEVRTVVVRGLSGVRGPAPVAALLFEETPESLRQRQDAAEMRRLAPEPAHSQPLGRPTKRDRRHIEGLRDTPPDWNDRWSASLDE